MNYIELYRPSAADLIPTMDDAERAAWLAQRCGKLTASRMRDAISFKKDGTPTVDRANYMRELLAERLTGITARHYMTPAMEWGAQIEPEAKLAYMHETGIRLEPSTFYDHPMIDMCGATPDAEIADGGLAEIKCPTTPTFISWTLAGVVPPEHYPQMLLQLACTGRKWVEFVAYDPRIQDEKRRLFIRRFKPEPDAIALIEAQATQFLAEVDVLWEQFTCA
jgi:predicted phage-related endonuclease